MESSKSFVADIELDTKKRLSIEEEYEIERKKSNSYHLIANSKHAECYVIDKENYLKWML